MDGFRVLVFFSVCVLLVSFIAAQLADEGSSLDRIRDDIMDKRRGCIGWTRYRNKCNRGRKRFLMEEEKRQVRIILNYINKL